MQDCRDFLIAINFVALSKRGICKLGMQWLFSWLLASDTNYSPIQVILHPEQDIVLSIRENARLQGFPDCYKLCGPIKERYMQVGNAVVVLVALGLRYKLLSHSSTQILMLFQL
ncbi:hypothetical protein KIW84_033195 [Lathyrus oleraceus]|uniref:DNA (cytosine-5-)-methyltransferase n=1 Tax=Pisum sativum TaxID=3888 RepID=A0A9D4XWZ5_PEA|nr:hypothetical protein KIW84_033195 [Pisum sativum]